MALMAITKAMEEIAAHQRDILDFLEMEKQTEMKGDIETLTEILNDYSYNRENPVFMQNREKETREIKSKAVKNVLFYEQRIRNQFKEIQSFIHLDTQKKLDEMSSKFKCYKMAVYEYAYASFMNIMLLGNFDSAYLTEEKKKITEYVDSYKTFHRDCSEQIKQYAGTSVQTRALQAGSATTKLFARAAGFAADKITTASKNKVDLNRYDLKNKIGRGGEKLDEISDSAIAKTVEAFSVFADSGIQTFAQNITAMDYVYNRPEQLLFDRDNLYIPDTCTELS